MSPENRTTVAIQGGDPLVGQALEILLRGVGYEVRVLGESEAFQVEDLLEGVDVLLLGPGLANGRREDFLEAMASTLETATIPVLALSPGPKGALSEEDRLVPWPSRIEDLSRAIEAAVRANGHLGAAQP